MAVMTCAVLLVASSNARAQQTATQPSTEPALDLSERDVSAEAPAAPNGSDWLTAPYERRGGFTVGIIAGLMMGGASGYPSDPIKIDREAFLTETGAAFGGAGSLWIGGAFADWLVFGIGGNGGTLVSADNRTTFGALAFHLEVYPAYVAGGVWQELGLLLETGIGGTSTKPADDDVAVIDSGAASRVSLGALYDGIRFGKLSMGPVAAVDLMWSPSVVRPAGWLGWRTALYTSP